MPYSVVLRRRANEPELVVRSETLERWPLHGMIGAIAWRFNGRSIVLVHIANKLGARARRFTC